MSVKFSEMNKPSLRILFIIRSWAHFPYHETIVQELCETGHMVIALFDPKWCDGYTTNENVRNFAEKTDNFTWDYLIPRSGWLQLPIFGIRELRNYARYLRYPEQSSFYLKRVEGHFPKLIQVVLRSRFVRNILTTNFFWRFFESFERIVLPSRKTIRLLKAYRPDVIVASPVNLWWSEEVDYIKAGKALRIPTVISVLSWDNVTTKGVFHEIPDLTLVWNEAHVREALKIQIPEESMIIMGAPPFDKWLLHDLTPSDYISFCKGVGFDPGKPFVVYLGSSQNIAKDESWIVEALAGELKDSSDEKLRELQILVRPHPSNAQGLNKVSVSNVIVWPPTGSLPYNRNSFQGFYDTLFHSKCTIGINTSGMLDALISGKPGITVLVDQYAVTQIDALHFQHLFNADALEVARNIAEIVELLSGILSGKDTKKIQRNKFVRNFIRPRGKNIPAGRVAAIAIEMIGSGYRPPEIDDALQKLNDCSLA